MNAFSLKLFKDFSKCLLKSSELNEKWANTIDEQERCLEFIKTNFSHCQTELIQMFFAKSSFEYNNHINNRKDPIYYSCQHLEENIKYKEKQIIALGNVKSCSDLTNIYVRK